ncbi:hypothetical protein D3C72_1079600 [compost metagenome]
MQRLLQRFQGIFLEFAEAAHLAADGDQIERVRGLGEIEAQGLVARVRHAAGQRASQAADDERLARLQRNIARAIRLVEYLDAHLRRQAIDQLVARIHQRRHIRARRRGGADALVQRGDIGQRGISLRHDRCPLLLQRQQLVAHDGADAVEALRHGVGRGDDLLAQRRRRRVDGGRVQGLEETVDAIADARRIVAHHAFELGQVRLGLRTGALVGRGAPHLLAFISIGKAQQGGHFHAIAGRAHTGGGAKR